MIRATLVRRAALALATLTLACGDSTGPKLSEAEVYELLEVMSVVAAFDDIPTNGPVGFSALRASAPATANATVTVSETVDCPNGGSATVSGTATDNPEAGTFNAQITHEFSACAATSEQGRVWTLNGNPNIVTTIGGSANEATGAFSITIAQIGGISFSSEIGSGSCQINITLTLNGDENSFSGSMNGRACGRTVQQSFEFSN